MSTPFLNDIIIEPERYELLDDSTRFEWTRRDFFRITGGGLVVAGGSVPRQHIRNIVYDYIRRTTPACG